MHKREVSTPIINIFVREYQNNLLNPNLCQEIDKLQNQQFFEQMNLFRLKGNVSSKLFHKNKLGKQNYCIGLTLRNWVWEGKNWRVYISKEGSSFEVKENLSLEDAISAWNEYYNLMK